MEYNMDRHCPANVFFQNEDVSLYVHIKHFLFFLNSGAI